ncbi:hypothetical protein MNBD_PLANCTO02-194 [hydrothermal vent metagenome]|uniref:Carbon storage regulator n=1 Tax=hydrothermal vent metagenome TaxID=652676 RepID=A0A3B1E815_9ZZZZ
MVVMSRRKNEAVVIGDNIKVTVIDIQDNMVRLGISTPDQTPSYWEETIFTIPETNESTEENFTQQQTVALSAYL